MRPESLTCEALIALAVAVLFIAVQALLLVTAVTTAVKVAFTARLPGAGTTQSSFCVPTAPVTVQPVVAVAQVTPPPAGSGSSVRVTPVAVPGPRLVTTMVKVAVAPARIVPASGVLAICSTGV